MEQKKAYIAGQISGIPYETAEAHFIEKGKELTANGYIVFNPIVEVFLENHVRELKGDAELPQLNDDDTRNHTMGFCINMMCQCDEVHMLPGWQQSKGASLERDIAIRLGIPVIYHRH